MLYTEEDSGHQDNSQVMEGYISVATDVVIHRLPHFILHPLWRPVLLCCSYRKKGNSACKARGLQGCYCSSNMAVVQASSSSVFYWQGAREADAFP